MFWAELVKKGQILTVVGKVTGKVGKQSLSIPTRVQKKHGFR
jgi:hypothetical protein